MTLVTAVIIALLVFSEFMYYRTIDIKYTYYVDPDIHREMFLTLDMTVAMKCDREMRRSPAPNTTCSFVVCAPFPPPLTAHSVPLSPPFPSSLVRASRPNHPPAPPRQTTQPSSI